MKIMFVANTDWTLYNFRLGLIKNAIEKGWEVYCLCKFSVYEDHLTKAGVKKVISLRKYQKGINLISDLNILIHFFAVYKRWKPDIVHHFTLKPVLYGSLGAYLAKIPIIINTVTGMGYIFTEGSKKWWIKHLVIKMYKICGKISDFFFFQNQEDRNFFIRKKLINNHKTRIVPGSGVDIDYFNPNLIETTIKDNLKKELGIQSNDFIILLVSRMLYEKGISEYVECAKRLKKKYKRLHFFLIGPVAPGNPAYIPLNVIKEWEADNLVEYLSKRDDIRELMSIADIITLPSYREGLSRVLLEASSMAKPIVTTDTVGCRDVVKHCENGLLVPIRDVYSLCRAIETLIKDQEYRINLGKKAREIAVSEFDEKIVIDKTLECYNFLLKKNEI